MTMNGIEHESNQKKFRKPNSNDLGSVLFENYFNHEKYPNVSKGHKYALDVINGKIVACIYIKEACVRYLKDLKRAEKKDCFFFYDASRAERFLRIAQKFKHVKGKWKDPFIIFEGWQCFMGINIFGFIDKETDSRRFRSAHIEIGRGNAKSTIASIMGLYFLCLEEPNGNEVYSAATKKDQAKIILDSARAMAKSNKSYRHRNGVQVLRHHIEHEESNSFFKALSSDSDGLDGLQPVLGLIDELHAHKTREVFDVIDSAMSKRNDSLMFSITTAGFKTTGIGYSESQYAKKLSLGETENDNFFALVFTLDEEDDHYDEKNWIKANPNLCVSVDLKNLRAKARKAKDDPESENNFLVKHLNVWTNASNPFFNIKKWEYIKDLGKVVLEDFKGEKCYAGIDLSTKIDLTSIGLVFHPDENYYLATRNFLPEARVTDLQNRNRELYRKWSNQGWLNLTPGETINYPKLEDEFQELMSMFSLQECYFDPWNATEFAQRMLMERIEMVEFRMNIGNLSEPMKKLDAVIRESQVRHEGSPLAKWCIGNVVAKKDANENVFPRKEHDELKIDPVIPWIMGMAGWMRNKKMPSVYETRGIIVL